MSNQKYQNRNPIKWFFCIPRQSQAERAKNAKNLYDASPSSNSLPMSRRVSSGRSPAHSISRPPCMEPKAGTFSKVLTKPFKSFRRFLSRKVPNQTIPPPNIVIDEAADRSSITPASIIMDERNEYQDADGLSRTDSESPETNMPEPRPPSLRSIDATGDRGLHRNFLGSAQRGPAISMLRLVPRPNDGNGSVHSASRAMDEGVGTSIRGHQPSAPRSLSVDAPRWIQDDTHTWKMHPHCTTTINMYEPFDWWTVSSNVGSVASSLTSLDSLYEARRESPLVTHKSISISVKIRLNLPWVRWKQISFGFTTNPYPALDLPGCQPGSVAVNIADARLYMGSVDHFLDLNTSFALGDTVDIGMRYSSTVDTNIESEVWVTKNGESLGTWSLMRELEGSSQSAVVDLMGGNDVFATVGTVDEQHLDVKLKKGR